MNDAVAACLRGTISPHVAVSRMLLGWHDSAAIRAEIEAARPEPPTPAWQALAAVIEGREAQLDHLVTEIRKIGSNHTALGGVDGIAGFFDHVAGLSPEAGVALYSFGDPAILARATAEIVDWLAAEGLLAPDTDVVDFGCGFGRVAAALAGRCRSVLGVDVSAKMIAEAQARYGALPGVRFAVTDGRAIPHGPFGLVLLADTMPYVVAAGFADELVASAAASLRPGGALAVLNLSYGRDPGADEADAARWAAAHGWAMTVSRPFKLWDGTAFLFR